MIGGHSLQGSVSDRKPSTRVVTSTKSLCRLVDQCVRKIRKIREKGPRMGERASTDLGKGLTRQGSESNGVLPGPAGTTAPEPTARCVLLNRQTHHSQESGRVVVR
jgi:hypothetical protein